MITAALAAGRLLTDLPAGWIADVVPARWALATAGTLLAAGAAVIATATTLAGLVVVRDCWGSPAPRSTP